jgi:hypothetical protein
MPDWFLALLRIPWTLVQAPWRWIRKKALDRQAIVSSGGDVVAAVQEFLGYANPINVSIEERPGAVTERLRDLDQDWAALRARIRKFTNGHPSKDVRRLGPLLIEEIEKLMLGLRYMSNKFTDPKERAAAYESVSARHGKASDLADDLLKEVHARS